MTDRHQRLEELFLQALELDPEELAAFLHSTCADDPELRAELLDLLDRDRTPDRPGTLQLVDRAMLEGVGEANQGDTPERIGRYRVTGVLGRGGMGEVLAARDPELDRPIAIKVLPDAFAADPKRIESFRREAQLLAALNHPNIATIHSFETDGALHFLTMERIRGDDLQTHLGTAPLSFDEALPLVRQMASALEAAHSRRIVHRDFKPMNVMLTGDGVTKVLDFGIAKTLIDEPPVADGGEAARPKPTRGAEASGSTPIRSPGTPGYMSPEQIHGEGIGEHSDIWAWACTVFAMLTGKTPFPGASTEARVETTLNDEPRWEALPADVSPRVRTLLERCLRKAPSDRPAAMVDVRRLLDEEIEARTRARVLAEAGATDGGGHEAGAPPHHIPARVSSFVGRRTELAEVTDHVRAHRMVSLVGFGGCGKTSLAQEVGRRSLAAFRDGVWFAALAPVTGAEGVGPALLAALRVPGSPMDDPMEQVIGRLRGREALLILDNCEHLATEAAETATHLLGACPELWILATSREPLRVEGERVHVVRPMDLPDPSSDRASATVAMESEAVALFCDRARAANPRFELTDANAGAVLVVCRRLDGIPLALELAAARLRALPLSELERRLDDRFRILTGGRRGGLPHHQTLRAAIDWSYEQLTPREQRLLARLSVFVGGWTLEAAEAVGIDPESGEEADRIEAWDVLDLLTNLVDRSLVEVETDGDSDLPPRYTMLETVQAYAAEQLGAAPESDEHARIVVSHGTFFAAWGTEDALDAVEREPARYDAYVADLRNLQAACRSAIEREDEACAADAFRGAAEVILRQGPIQTALDLGRSTLHMITDPTRRARVLEHVALAETYAGDMDASRIRYGTALAIHREVGDRKSEGITLSNLGRLHQNQGRMELALEHYESALTVFREIGHRPGEGEAWASMGYLCMQQGRMEQALEHMESALAVHREVGARALEGFTLGGLGVLHHEQGRLELAQEHYERSLIVHREVGNRVAEATQLGNLANLLQARGRMELAEQHFESALAAYREFGHRRGEAIVLHYLGGLRSAQGRMELARTNYETALVMLREIGDRYFEGIALRHLGDLNRKEDRLDDARRCFVESVRVFTELTSPRQLVASLVSRGDAELRQGHRSSAEVTLGEIESIEQRSWTGREEMVEAFRNDVRAAADREPTRPDERRP